MEFSILGQGTSFTYQGRLNDGVTPAAGLYDLRFALYDAPSGGAQQGSFVTNQAVAVSNGLFGVMLDFGNQFTGSTRWLEIGVRTNGGGAFTALAPRQQLTATPYAVVAGNVTGPIDGSAITPFSITRLQLGPGSVITAAIATNAITSALIASGAV